jgi:hypothetical protein
LIDAILDGEVGPAESRALFEQLRDDPDAAGDLNATRRAIGALREPVRAPDFSDRVLETVGRKRGGWLSRRDRRLVTAGRIAAAVGVVALIGGMYMMERARPGTLDVSGQPRAVAGLTDSLSESSSRIASDFASGTRAEMARLSDSAFGVVQLLTESQEPTPGTARVVFEWPFDEGGEFSSPPRLLVFSDQPVSAASLAEQFSSITRQAGEAERSLRPGGALERLIDSLPKVVDRELITSIGEFASSRLMPVSNVPVRSGEEREAERPAMPILITLPGFEPVEEEIRDPE